MRIKEQGHGQALLSVGKNNMETLQYYINKTKEKEMEFTEKEHEAGFHDYRIHGCYECDKRADKAFSGQIGWDYDESDYRINDFRIK